MSNNILDLDYKASFSQDNFIISSFNNLAYESLYSWANIRKCNKDNNYENNNIKILLGEKFSGKSSLLYIIRNELEKLSQKLLILDIRQLEKEDTIVLLLEDYDYIAIESLEYIISSNNSRKIEENIFYLINYIINHKKNLVITTSDNLHDYNFKIKDLESRFQVIKFIKIDSPKFEEASKLLMKHFADRQIRIDKKLLKYILNNIKLSHYNIYNFVEKISKLSLLKNKKISINLVKDIISKESYFNE